MAYALTELLASLDPARIKRATAWVEWEKNPDVPGRTCYRITGGTRELVQGAIDDRMNEAAESPNGGGAVFHNPWLNADGKWETRGEVVKNPAPAPAEPAE